MRTPDGKKMRTPDGKKMRTPHGKKRYLINYNSKQTTQQFYSDSYPSSSSSSSELFS
jgi:hypothetical protein